MELLLLLTAWLGFWTLLSLAGSHALASIEGMLRFAPLILVPVGLYSAGPEGRQESVLLTGISVAVIVAFAFAFIQYVAGIWFTFYPELGSNIGVGGVDRLRYPGPM